MLLGVFSEFSGLSKDVRESRRGGAAKWTVRGRAARWALLGSILFAGVQLKALPSLASSYGAVVGGGAAIAVASLTRGPRDPDSFLLLARVACILQLIVLAHDMLRLSGSAAILQGGTVFHLGLGTLLFVKRLGPVVAYSAPPMTSSAAGEGRDDAKVSEEGQDDGDDGK